MTLSLWDWMKIIDLGWPLMSLTTSTVTAGPASCSRNYRSSGFPISRASDWQVLGKTQAGGREWPVCRSGVCVRLWSYESWWVTVRVRDCVHHIRVVRYITQPLTTDSELQLQAIGRLCTRAPPSRLVRYPAAQQRPSPSFRPGAICPILRLSPAR